MTRLLLLRHGLSEWNAAGRWQGWADAPLADLGRSQAEVAGRLLAGDGGADAVAASDLSRAVATAEVLVEALATGPVEIDPALRERGVGQWEGLTRPEIEVRWPGALAASPLEPPGGEPVATVLARVLAAVGRLADRHPASRVVVVTHGGVVRQVEDHLGLAPQAIPNLGGRWIEVDGPQVRAGERVLLADPDQVPVTTPRQL